VQEEERRAISRELHDDVGQSLSALKIGLHRLEQEASRPSAVLSECVAVAGTTLERLRQMALELRPPQLDQLGLEEALEWLAERQRKATGLSVVCRFHGIENRRPPATLESACYRIAQEGLNNAARHAQAKNVRIQVDADSGLLRLAIHDDGVGFDAEAARQRSGRCGHLGLISMEERARLAGGRLKLRSVAGAGTTLTAIFPLGPASDGELSTAAA
jgi:signal transduction histidine kinase